MVEELGEGNYQYLELLDKPPFNSDREIALAFVQADLGYSIDLDSCFENLSKELRSDKEIRALLRTPPTTTISAILQTIS